MILSAAIRGPTESAQAAIAKLRTFIVLDALIKRRHVAGMIGNRNTATTWLFWLVAAVWLVTALPIIIFSLMVLEVPLWPSFSAESTVEGTLIWAVVATWFYVTPVMLTIVARRRRRTTAL